MACAWAADIVIAASPANATTPAAADLIVDAIPIICLFLPWFLRTFISTAYHEPAWCCRKSELHDLHAQHSRAILQTENRNLLS
jgi:hypothetical protein